MADYQWFVQKHGPRKGQKYRVKAGASGLSERVYQSGDTADVKKRITNPYGSPMARKVASGPPNINPFSRPMARRRRPNG